MLDVRAGPDEKPVASAACEGTEWPFVPLLRSISLLILLCLCAASCRKQPAPANEPAAKPAVAEDTMGLHIPDGEGDGCVWVVDGKEGGGRLFLCGTIHILREKDYPLAPGYEAAYMYSDKLVLELAPGEASNPELPKRMAQIGMYTSDASLDENITADCWARTQAWAKKHNIDASSLKRYRPWYVSIMLTATEYADLGAKPELGVDTHFEQRAKDDGKPGEGLETPDFQIQMFAGLTKKQQADLLEQTLAEVDVVGREYEKMIAAWRHGRLDALYEMLFSEAEKHPELVDLFLTARNLMWMDKLEVMLKRGDKAMILVGAGHLAGPSGLIELMQKRGHRVRHYREVKDF